MDSGQWTVDSCGVASRRLEFQVCTAPTCLLLGEGGRASARSDVGVQAAATFIGTAPRLPRLLRSLAMTGLKVCTAPTCLLLGEGGRASARSDVGVLAAATLLGTNKSAPALLPERNGVKQVPASGCSPEWAGFCHRGRFFRAWRPPDPKSPADGAWSRPADWSP